MLNFVPLSFKNEKIITVTNILSLGAGYSCLLCKLCGQIVINTNVQHTLFFFYYKTESKWFQK